MQGELAKNGVLSRETLIATAANEGLQVALAKHGVLSREAFSATAANEGSQALRPEMNTKDLDSGEIKMKYRLLFGSVVLAILFITFQQVAGQYRNPYNGVNHTSQLAKFYDMTRTWNSDLYKAMSRYQATKDRLKDLARSYGGSSRAGSTITTAPASGSATPAARSESDIRRYPITATDFKPVGARLAPDQIANSTPGLTGEQRDGLRALSNHSLTEFEREARKNNIANAMTFLLEVSLYTLTGGAFRFRLTGNPA